MNSLFPNNSLKWLFCWSCGSWGSPVNAVTLSLTNVVWNEEIGVAFLQEMQCNCSLELNSAFNSKFFQTMIRLLLSFPVSHRRIYPSICLICILNEIINPVFRIHMWCLEKSVTLSFCIWCCLRSKRKSTCVHYVEAREMTKKKEIVKLTSVHSYNLNNFSCFR